MNITTLAMGFGALLIFFMAIKIIIKLPFYIMTFAILGGLGYLAYTVLLPMLGM